MSDVPSIAKRIQEEEVQVDSPVSESTARKLGGTMNFLLDHYALPPGGSMKWNGLESAVPIGWYPEDGRAKSRTTDANLFAAIGTLWGVGDSLTTFNIPDKRGAFERMCDATSIGAAGRDPESGGRTPQGDGLSGQPGSYQADQFRSHNHRFIGTGGSDGAGVFAGPADSAGYITVSNAGGSETRPKNLYVHSIIKW